MKYALIYLGLSLAFGFGWACCGAFSHFRLGWREAAAKRRLYEQRPDLFI